MLCQQKVLKIKERKNCDRNRSARKQVVSPHGGTVPDTVGIIAASSRSVVIIRSVVHTSSTGELQGGTLFSSLRSNKGVGDIWMKKDMVHTESEEVMKKQKHDTTDGIEKENEGMLVSGICSRVTHCTPHIW